MSLQAGLVQNESVFIKLLLLLTQAVQALMRMAVGADFPGWGYFIGPLIASLIWVPLTFVLLLPQYQPVEQNPDRPI